MKNWNAKEPETKNVNPGVSKVHNLIIVDESGSMGAIYHAALTGMNETLNTIRKIAKDSPQQEQSVTLVTFDSSHYNRIFNSIPASETREITSNDYQPGGNTPLYDAMGKALTDLEPLVKENEAVLVTVITDGYENCSSEYSLAEIRALVDRLDKAGWVFTYIGANQDADAVGAAMGISATLNFEANDKGMADMWEIERNSRKAFLSETMCSDFSINGYKRGSYFKKK